MFLNDDDFPKFTSEADGNGRVPKNSSSASQTNAQAPTVLIVEDDADSRLMLRLLIEIWRYRVVEAANGIEALIQAEKETPDLVLMDVKMPRLDGFETTRCLRSSAKITRVPIVFLSGCAEEIYRRAAFDAGATEYLVKPLDFEDLEKILDRHTAKREELTIVKKLKLSEILMTNGGAPETILQRLGRGEQAAVSECVEAYGNLIWALAKKFTSSRGEAEDFAAQVFLRIWHCAERFDPAEMNESDFIRLIAFSESNNRSRRVSSLMKLDLISAAVM